MCYSGNTEENETGEISEQNTELIVTNIFFSFILIILIGLFFIVWVNNFTKYSFKYKRAKIQKELEKEEKLEIKERTQRKKEMYQNEYSSSDDEIKVAESELIPEEQITEEILLKNNHF